MTIPREKNKKKRKNMEYKKDQKQKKKVPQIQRANPHLESQERRKDRSKVAVHGGAKLAYIMDGGA